MTENTPATASASPAAPAGPAPLTRVARGIVNQPINRVQWIHRDKLTPNEYNPNHQDPSRFTLLFTSILEDGWTQPIVAFQETSAIVDGEHRWRVSGRPEIYALTEGFVPVVWLSRDEAGRMISTCRHNLSRGTHSVRLTIEVVRGLLKELTPEEIMRRLQMEPEELQRLSELAGMPVKISTEKAKGFSQGWIPVEKKAGKK